MRPERKRVKAKLLAYENIPTVFVMLVLICGLLLFGADSAGSSLVVSLLIFGAVLISIITIRDVQISSVVKSMLIMWGVFVGLNYITGRTTGAEDEYLMLLSAIGIFGLGQYGGQSSNRIQITVKLFLVVGLLFAVFAFLQHIMSPNMVLGTEKPYHRGRLTGTFLSSNTTASFLGIILLISLAYFRRTWLKHISTTNAYGLALVLDVFQKISLALICCLFSFICLLLTASRAGIASACLAVIVFGVWITMQQMSTVKDKRKGRKGMRLLILIGTGGFIVYFWNLSGGLVSERYGNTLSHIAARADTIDALWSAFLYQPWFGYGLGNFDAARLLGTTPATNAHVVAVHAAHNVYLQWLVQVGIVGVTMFSCVYGFVLAKIYQGARKARRYKTYCVAILCVTLLLGFHGIFDYAMEIPIVMLSYTYLVGIGYGISMRYVTTD